MVFVLSRRGTFLCLRIQFTQRSCLLTYACFCNALQEGTVLAFDPSSGTVKIELSKESLKKSLGMLRVNRFIRLTLDSISRVIPCYFRFASHGQ